MTVMERRLTPGAVRGTLRPPASKSDAQRALAAALLAEGRSRIEGLDLCGDTSAMLLAVEALGAEVQRTADGALLIEGGLHPTADRIPVGESGLALRLLAPVAALCERPLRLEATGSLRRRPALMEASVFAQLGAVYHDEGEFAPVTVRGPLRGGEVQIDASYTSQFLTGLLFALPVAATDSRLLVEGAVSTPYLEMTLATIRRFGVEIPHDGYGEFRIAGGQRYRPTHYAVERDWSAAAVLLTAGAVAGAVRIEGLDADSLQPDRNICTALERAGAGIVVENDAVRVYRRPLRAFRFDATECCDLFPALAALAAAADGVSEIRGVHRLRHKESDRAAALAQEYARMGIAIRLGADDTMYVCGGTPRPARVEAHGDHRIAMSLALTSLRSEGPVLLEGDECVAKSYPSFFDDLEQMKTDIR